MSDSFKDSEEVFDVYFSQYNEQVKELNRQIVALKTRNALLQEEIDEFNRLPVPSIVQKEMQKLVNENKKLQEDVKYYKKYVPVQKIINREEKKKPTRSGGLLR